MKRLNEKYLKIMGKSEKAKIKLRLKQKKGKIKLQSEMLEKNVSLKKVFVAIEKKAFRMLISF